MKIVSINTKDELEAFYRGILPSLQMEARHCGYALAVHGSMRRDLDLIAVPWSEKQTSQPHLVHRLMLKACGYAYSVSELRKRKEWWDIAKPHGRVAICVALPPIEVAGQGNAMLDISFTPKV